MYVLPFRTFRTHWGVCLRCPLITSLQGILDHLDGIRYRDRLQHLPEDEGYAARIGIKNLFEVQEKLEQLVGGAEQMFLSDPESATPFSRTLTSYAMASGWTDLGNMWIARGDTTMAVNSLRRALHWKTDHLNALLHIAALLRAVGHADDACYVVQMIERKVPREAQSKDVRNLLSMYFSGDCRNLDMYVCGGGLAAGRLIGGGMGDWMGGGMGR